MRLSVVIPQAFYDVIARVLPGFFFLMVLLVGLPNLMRGILPLGVGPGGNAIESLGHGIAYAGLCYFLGLLFRAFTWASKEGPTKKSCEEKQDSKSRTKRKAKSLNHMYQWLRLSHPSAGFRIVKLRAEARMLETSRTAMVVAAVIIGVFLYPYLFDSCEKSGAMELDEMGLIQGISGLLLAVLAAVGFRISEEGAWHRYWGNIVIVYELLHNRNDPIRV